MLLWWADAGPQAERALRDLEVEAVRDAPMTPGLRPMLHALHARGHSVTIVNNNSADADRSFVAAHDLAACICAVVARTEHDTKAAQCVLLGDSVTDIEAEHAAGVAVVAFANRARKHDQLSAAGPRTIVSELAAAHLITDIKTTKN